jgi:hypothetical protein
MVLALALIVSSFVFVPIAEAANPITEARADLAEIKGKLIRFSDFLIQLRESFEELDDSLQALEDAVTDYVDLGWGIEPLEIEALISEIEGEKELALLLLTVLEEFTTDEILPELEALQVLVEGLIAEGKIKGRVATSAHLYLGQLLLLVNAMTPDLSQLREFLDDDVAEICLNDIWKLNPDVDLFDCLEDAADSIRAEDWEKALEEVMAAERLLDGASLKHRLIFRQRLRNIAGLVRRLDRQLARAERQYARRVRGADLIRLEEQPAAAAQVQLQRLSADQFVLQLEGSPVSALQLQLFALDGRLLLKEQADGNCLEFRARDLQGRPLANGVYLYVLTAYTPEGQEIRGPLRKLFVLR